MKIFFQGLTVAFVTVALDQWSKDYIFNLLATIPDHTIKVTSFFNLVMVHNYGISFGMFDNIEYGQLILSFIALSIIVVLLVWLYRESNFYISIALGLIIGGAVGNVIDRIRLGAVVDFLDFYIGDYHWPAFNIADSAVFIGVGILLTDSFLTSKTKTEEKNVN